MEQTSTQNKKILQDLKAQIKVLQTKLKTGGKHEEDISYIEVRVKKNQARFERIKQKGKKDTEEGRFYLALAMTALEEDVYVPLSIASGKKVAGFMYQIEGSAPGNLLSAEVRVRGVGVSMITIGTLLYAKIPARKMATFEIRTRIKGTSGNTYRIVFTRVNYKKNITDARYQQYLHELSSEFVTFS